MLANLGGKSPCNVYHSALSTCTHGSLPQQRSRIYVDGMSSDVDLGTFEWPPPVACKPLSAVIDQHFQKCLRSSQKTRLENLMLADTAIKKKGLDMWSSEAIVDVDHGRAAARYMIGMCPCITAARGKSQAFFTEYNKLLHVDDLMRLQGADPKVMHASGLSDGKLGHICGNAMTVSLVRRILTKLLPAAGLVEHMADDLDK